MNLIIDWIISSVSLYIVSLLIPGVQLTNFYSAMIAAIVLGLVNAFIRPVLLFFTLPINIVTFGFFTFVVNALLFLLTSFFVSGFGINGFMSAFIGSLLFTFIRMAIRSVMKDRN